MRRLAYPLLILTILVPIAATAVAFFIAPDTMPMQVNFEGEITRYGSKSELLIVGGIMASCNILMAACYAGADKLNSMGMLNTPRSWSGDPVKLGRAALLGCAVSIDVIWIGLLVYLLSLV